MKSYIFYNQFLTMILFIIYFPSNNCIYKKKSFDLIIDEFENLKEKNHPLNIYDFFSYILNYLCYYLQEKI